MWKSIKTIRWVLRQRIFFSNIKKLFNFKGLTPELSKMLIECKFSKEELEKNKGKILEALILCKEGIRFENLPPEKTVC